MTLEFQKQPIIEQDLYNSEPFIGYINPRGEFINYNKMFGEPGHEGWDNKITQTFLKYISFIVKDTSIEEDITYGYSKEELFRLVKYPGIVNYVIRGFSMYPSQTESELIENLKEDLDYFIQSCKYLTYDSESKFIQDLLLFYKNAYSSKTFFETIGRIFAVEEKSFFNNQFSYTRDDRNRYFEYLRNELMQYFKDIVVMYLGYDSVERFKPNSEKIIVPYKWVYYEEASYSYPEPMPRIITTSSFNINERFYNYLLMDWSIHRVPRYFFDEQNKKYEKESNIMSFHQNEKERILEKEIKAIRRLVPVKDRYKYFR